MRLMRSQKNSLLEEIKQTTFDIINFEWDNQIEGSTEKLIYRGTEYYFAIEIDDDYFYTTFSPGENMLREENNTDEWEEVLYLFRLWIVNLKREISQPDLWEELRKIKIFENIEFETENNIQQFTYQETLQIQEGINNIRDYLFEEVKGNTEEIKAINEKLDYLIDASKRMGRIDWKNVFVGTLVNIITSVGLNPEQGQMIATLFQNAVSGIMKLVSIKGA